MYKKLFFIKFLSISKKCQLDIIRKTVKGFEKKVLQNLSKSFRRKKNNKRKYGCEPYSNVPEDETQRLVEYRKNYFRMQKLIKTSWFLYY